MGADGDGIRWREFFMDKGVDVVLVPLGLFAALWLQRWVDDQKEREDYKSLLVDFQVEIDTNLGLATAMEKDLGTLDKLDGDGVLGPMAKTFDSFEKDTEAATKQVECVGTVMGVLNKQLALATAQEVAAAPPVGAPGGAGQPVVPPPAPVTPEEQKASDDCEKLLNAPDDAGEEFRPVDLSPLYRYEVWNVYLANGIKLFKDDAAKKLRLRLGEVYANAREVERQVADIEKLYNETFMAEVGEFRALEARFNDLMPENPSADDLKKVQAAAPEIAKAVIEARYGVMRVRGVVQLKVQRMKRLATEMNKKFKALRADLDREASAI